MVNRGISRRGCTSAASRRNDMSSGNKDSLMKQLQKIDFAIVEVGLYLDMYPNCEKGLAYYHKLCEERRQLAYMMSEGGMPITMRENSSKTDWDWTNAPWPWQLDAN